jgi:hypothetical protein
MYNILEPDVSLSLSTVFIAAYVNVVSMSISIASTPRIGLNVFTKGAMSTSAYSVDKLEAAFLEEATSKKTTLEDLSFIVGKINDKISGEERQTRLKKLALKCCDFKKSICIIAFFGYADNTTLLDTFVRMCEIGWFGSSEILNKILIGTDLISVVGKRITSNELAKKGINDLASSFLTVKSDSLTLGNMTPLAFETIVALVGDETIRQNVCVKVCNSDNCITFCSAGLLKGLSDKIKKAMAMNMYNMYTLLAMHTRGMDFSSATLAVSNALTQKAFRASYNNSNDMRERLTSKYAKEILTLTERAPPLSAQSIAMLVAIAVNAEASFPSESLTFIFSDKVPRANNDKIKELVVTLASKYHMSIVTSAMKMYISSVKGSTVKDMI